MNVNNHNVQNLDEINENFSKQQYSEISKLPPNFKGNEGKKKTDKDNYQKFYDEV